MRKNGTLILLVVAVAILSQPWKGLWRTHADEPAATPQAPVTRLALLDLSRIYATHTQFKKSQDVLRREVETAERALAVSKAELQAAAAELEALPKPGKEAKQLEEKIARETAEVTVTVNKQKRDFFEQEAAMYYETYQEMMAAVAAYSKPRGINFVMRFNVDPYDPSDPNALQKELNKAVLYHDGIDITDDIIAIVNARSGEKQVAEKSSDAAATR